MIRTNVDAPLQDLQVLTKDLLLVSSRCLAHSSWYRKCKESVCGAYVHEWAVWMAGWCMLDSKEVLYCMVHPAGYFQLGHQFLILSNSKWKPGTERICWNSVNGILHPGFFYVKLWEKILLLVPMTRIVLQIQIQLTKQNNLMV